MRPFLAILLALLALAPANAEGQRWAILVGVDRYERADVTPLNFAVADVRAVAAALRSRGGFPSDNVFVLTSDQPGDGAPTRGNVAFRLGWLAERVRPQDQVVFYFAGHGIEMGESTYLMTVEADPRSAQTLQLTGFARDDLVRLLKDLKAAQVLVILDACRNDPRGGRGSGDNLMSDRMARDLALVGSGGAAPSGARLTATLFACSPGQRSYEWTDANQGFFSYFLVQALEGKAADASGKVTLEGTVRYLRSEVPRATERVTGQRQEPFVQFEGTDMAACVLATGKPGAASAAPPAPVPPRPQPTPAAAAQPQPAASNPLDSRWLGTWHTALNFGGTLYYFERQNRADGTFVDYGLGPTGRTFIRSGVNELFGDGRCAWRCTEGDKKGLSESGSYEWLSQDAVRLRYTTYDGVPFDLTWTRAR